MKVFLSLEFPPLLPDLCLQDRAMGSILRFSYLVSLLILSISFHTYSISTLETKVRYNGYRIYRVTALQESHIQAVMLLKEQGVRFWGVPSLTIGGNSDIIVPPHLLGMLQGLMEMGMKLTLLHADLQKLIESQQPSLKQQQLGTLDWTSYHRLKNIYAFMEKSANNSLSRKSGTKAETFSVGTSYEGRNILGIKIFSANKKTKRAKPGIWLDSNIHAREWITSAVSTYLINELLTTGNSSISQWTKYFDWYIVPVVNPDGFEYSHTTDRLWRKSRSTTDSVLGCRGVDLNRNFGFYWNETGTSGNPCSNHYSGTSGFSEPESQALANSITDLIVNKKVDMQFYLSLHSFSQMILLPFGFNNTRIPQYKTYMRLAKAASAAHAARFGTRFAYGTIMDLLYPVSGCSADWVKGVYDVPLTLTYELRDQGHFAALLPPSQIIPSSQEFIDGLSVYLTELRKGIPSVDPLDL